MTIRLKLLLLFMALVGSMSLFSGDVARANSPVQAVWVWTDEVTAPGDRSTLVQRSAASGVTDLYLSVYQSTPNSAGRLMYEDSNMVDLIRLAHRHGIRVWAAYGAPDWPTLVTPACDPTAFPLQRMAEVVSYNNGKDTNFAGVVLDVEPPEPQSPSDFQALLNLYQCIRSFLPHNLRLAVAIPFFWDTPVEFPVGGQIKPVYQHIIDMDLDNVVVMGYRNLAGDPCPNDGIICLDQDEIVYAAEQHRNGNILVGLETANCVPGCGPSKVTFSDEGQLGLNLQAQVVANHFDRYNSFGGFAIDRYKDSYLSGTEGWPATNPTFP